MTNLDIYARKKQVSLSLPEGVRLPPRALAILGTVVAADGQPVSTNDIYLSIYSDAATVKHEIVKVLMHRIRKELGPHGVEITTAPRVGYTLAAEGAKKLKGELPWK